MTRPHLHVVRDPGPVLPLPIEPFFAHVTVSFADGKTHAFQILDKVTDALERAGEYKAAAQFREAVADYAETDEEMMAMAHTMVTVVM